MDNRSKQSLERSDGTPRSQRIFDPARHSESSEHIAGSSSRDTRTLADRINKLPEELRIDAYYRTIVSKLSELPLKFDEVRGVIQDFIALKDTTVLEAISHFYDDCKNYPHIRKAIANAFFRSKNAEGAIMLAQKYDAEGIYDTTEAIRKVREEKDPKIDSIVINDMHKHRTINGEDIHVFIAEAVCESEDPIATRMLVQNFQVETNYSARRIMANAVFESKDIESARILSQSYATEENVWVKSAMKRAIRASGDPEAMQRLV